MKGMLSSPRIGVFLTLIVVNGVVWGYVGMHVSKYRGELREQYRNFREALLLPMRMSELSARPPDRELFMPVRGVEVEDVADSWDDPRSGGRAHEGTDIFAPHGTPVYSATGGYVLRVGENNLGGNIVLVGGAGGRRYYYAHLYASNPKLAFGVRVGTTTIIGYVGNTGNAEHTPPHLHLGIYTSEGPVNPHPLLVDQ